MDLQHLEAVFENDYRPKLESLDSQRKNAIKVIMIGILVVPLVTLLAFWIVESMNKDPKIALFVGGGVLVIFGLIYHNFWGAYRSAYKQQVVGTMLATMYPTLAYNQNGRVSVSRYEASGLYPKSFDRYSGEDHVQGKIGKTEIEFSELHTEYKTESRDSKGNRSTTWHTIFKGVFFSADFNKHFNGKLFIVPDGHGLFSSIGKFFTEKFGGMGERIALENTTFERYFEVYGSDQIEARYILSPTFMELLVAFRENYRNDLRMSFINESLFIAIPSSRDHFEPKLFTSATSFEVVKDIYLDLKFLTDIVEELDLNTRIWTKN